MRTGIVYSAQRKAEQQLDWSGGERLDAADLAAQIIHQAVLDWRDPSLAAYSTFCFGDAESGIEECPSRSHYGCFKFCGGYETRVPVPGGRYFCCAEKRSRLRQELVKFFNSPWFERICSVDPTWLRSQLGVPTVKQEQVA